MLRWLKTLPGSYAFVLLFALTVGIVFSRQTAGLAAYGHFWLGGIFFLSALRLELGVVLSHLRDAKVLLIVNALMLIVFPAVVYLVAQAVAPQYALAFLLLAAMPAGMTSPFLAEMSGGNQGLALVLTASTSLLAPLTVPLVIKILVGAQVSVGFWAMVLTLAKVIFIPFLLAQVVRVFWRRGASAIMRPARSLSLLLLGLLILGIVAQRADTMLLSLRTTSTLGMLLAMTLLFIAFMGVGYLSVYWRNRADRMTVALCLTFMNFTLAIYLASQYFPQPGVLVPVMLSVLPWSLLLIPFSSLSVRVSRDARS